MSKLRIAALCAFVIAQLFVATACKTTGGDIDSGTAGNVGSGGTVQGGAGSGGNAGTGGAGSGGTVQGGAGSGGSAGTGGAALATDAAVSVADSGDFTSVGKCTVQADCAKNYVCLTYNKCDQGFCYPIPAACAAKGDSSCACVGDVLCPRAFCSPSPAGCLTCSVPP